jgi:hypothetical protein
MLHQLKEPDMGRPSDYRIEIAEKICEELAKGRHLHMICEEDDWAPAERTVYQWLNKQPEFAQLYAHARERQQEVFAAQVILIADTVKDAAIARNMMDARKWYAARVAPRKWGDKIEIDAKVETTGTGEALTAFLAALEAKARG